MTFCGIDYDSNRVDLVMVDVDTPAPAWTRFELGAGDTFQRARNVRNALWPRTSYHWEPVTLVALEQPVGQRRDSLMRMQGCILACLPIGAEVWPMKPHEWRVALGLPGSGKRDVLKAETRAYALEHGAPDGWPQDAYDAFLIALAALTLCEKAAA